MTSPDKGMPNGLELGGDGISGRALGSARKSGINQGVVAPSAPVSSSVAEGATSSP